MKAIGAALLGWTVALAASMSQSSGPQSPRPAAQGPAVAVPPRVSDSPADAAAASAGCITCHTKTDVPSMHPSGTVSLGCATCHGGDPKVSVAAGLSRDAPDYNAAKTKAHPQSRMPDIAKSSANPTQDDTESETT